MNSNRSQYVVFGLGLVICVAVFLLIFFSIPGEGPSGLDRAVGDWISGMEHIGVTKAAQVVAYMGESLAIIVLTLLLTAVATWFMGIRKSLWIIAGVAVSYVMNVVIKAWIARPRPDGAWGIEVDGYSFPSGNAMLAVALYGMFAIWMWNYGRISRGVSLTIGGVALLMIVLIGWSRLYFSVHYVTDILAGYAVGGCIVLLLMIVERRLGKSW